MSCPRQQCQGRSDLSKCLENPTIWKVPRNWPGDGWSEGCGRPPQDRTHFRDIHVKTGLHPYETRKSLLSLLTSNNGKNMIILSKEVNKGIERQESARLC